MDDYRVFYHRRSGDSISEQSKIVEPITMPTYVAGVVLSLIKDDHDGIVLKGEVFMKHTAYMKTMLRC